LCEIDDAELFWRAKDFNYVRCRTCQLVYVNPRLKDAALQKIYEGNWAKNLSKKALYSIRDMASLQNLDQRLRRAEFLFEEVENYKTGGRILDIGCNRGFLLAVAASRGWEAYGVEVVSWMPRLVEREFGSKIFVGKLREVSPQIPDGFFDVVTLIDILEHFQNPVADLLEINRLLQPDGFLMINTPDLGSAHAHIFQERWGHANPTEHLFLFTRSTLSHLLERTGFRIRRFKTSKGSVGEMEVHVMKEREVRP